MDSLLDLIPTLSGSGYWQALALGILLRATLVLTAAVLVDAAFRRASASRRNFISGF
ncbi:hypothetical protein SAMN05444166_2225 [Singulisphaera sp. GP187]|uniref:hypothetical protein n=1 Tax=Singulisphaera sp. GP187 TaxID=1882752 RepID=UPI00092ACB00|nr:hypothetical protein [Singulisphaera sp. GP187]SIO05537.1 hypothetical protein SAMN05444166_2225 [Singulisphaera sp. GP187]